jgi:phosphate transport system permease protein
MTSTKTPERDDAPIALFPDQPERPVIRDGRAYSAAIIAATGCALLFTALAGGKWPTVLIVLTYATFSATLWYARRRRTVMKPPTLVDLVALEAAEPPAANDRPVRQRKVHDDDLIEVAIAAAGAFAFVELVRVVFEQRSMLGSFLWFAGAFLGIVYLLMQDRANTAAASDRVITMLVWGCGIGVLAVLVWMLTFVTAKGLKRLRWSFFVEDMARVGPLTPGGGAVHAIIGTFEQVGLAVIIVVPIAILTAVYLNEIKGRLAGPIRFFVDAMSGLPSIVAGLLVYSLVVVPSKHYSGAAGSVALTILMLPTVTRASEEILRTVSDALREGALALGAPRWRLVMQVVLPTARTGLVTAAILGVARAIGETAPMLLTAFGADTTNKNVLSGPQSDLPLFVWKLIREPNSTQNQRAWTGALVLLLLVLILFVIARLVSNLGQRKLRRA